MNYNVPDIKALVEKWSSVEGKMSIASEQDQDIKKNLAVLLENQEQVD